MELLRTWIIGVVAASLLLAAAETAAPAGTVKRAVRLAGGLILFISVVSPLKNLDSSELAYQTQQYRAGYEEYEDAFIYENSVMIKEIIEDRTRTYILQKADSLSLGCEVNVTAETRESGGYPYPSAVTVTARDATPEQKAELTRYIAAELGVDADHQIWSTS